MGSENTYTNSLFVQIGNSKAEQSCIVPGVYIRRSLLTWRWFAFRMGACSIQVASTAVIAVFNLCLLAINGYEIVYPFKADNSEGKREFSTNIDGKHQDNVAFVIKREVGDMVLEMKRSTGFHRDKVLVRTFDENGDPKVEMHAPDSCYYSGKISDNEDSFVLLDTCNGIRGSIEDGEKRYNIEPIEDEMEEGAHKLYEVENDDLDLAKRTLGINPFSDDYIDVPSEPQDDAAKDVEFTREDEMNEPPANGLIPEVDPVYKTYPITKKTRYCEMFLVVEKAIYEKYNKDKKLILSKMLNVIHAVDRSYAAVNIRLVLVALEIWTDKNKIPYTKSGGSQVSLFNTYRKSHLLQVIPHDIAHYMSIKGWSGGVIGMAYVGGICQKGYGTGINLWSFSSLTGPNVVLAHELGHNFGFPHDGSSCTCLTKRGCFMGGPKTRRPGFSDCNMKVLSDPNRSFGCLNNYPRGSLDNVCGNGIIEGSEECDCGTPEACKMQDSCCQPHKCKLKPSSQCSDFNTPDCCKNCLFKGQGAICRESQNMCDLPEYCTGISGTCPADVHMRDGTSCSSKVSILQGSLTRAEKFITLSPPVKARFFRFHPVYQHSEYACMRMEIYTCSANEDVVNVPQPISTPGLYYTNALCFVPNTATCAESQTSDPSLIYKSFKQTDCNHPNNLFVLEKNGDLKHHCSGKIVCADSKNYFSLKTTCPNNRGKFERLANSGLKHTATGGCVEADGGWPKNGYKAMIRWTKNCAGGSSRNKLRFLETDCLMPVGMENRKLQDSAFSATKFHSSNPPKEARLNTGKSWCPPKGPGNKEYLQVDIQKIKTVRFMRVEGTYWNWVTGFKLFYSDDGKSWKGYASNNDADKGSSSFCFTGSCIKSLNTQCQDLWDAGTKSANASCWNKLNTEAKDFGTCDPAKSKPCAADDVFCGQIQCSSSRKSPSHVKYASSYKELVLNGAKCSMANMTSTGSSNDQIGNREGMVADGTKCGDGKMCSGYQCKSISELKLKECPKGNGVECAGQGTCDNKGTCHCTRGYDPATSCTKTLVAVDGSWSAWNDWSKCTAACNGGTKKRSRFCDAPIPTHGGKSCLGVGFEEKQCNTESCPKAKSCKVLMMKLVELGKPMVDGVYEITIKDGSVMKMYCDMTRNGGGWTLIVASAQNDWTSSDMIRARNIDKPSLLKDYSILKYVDEIKDDYNIEEDRFEYRLEAHARGRWGGIWSAPITYKIDTTSSQADVKLTKKFDNWPETSKGIGNRVPHIIKNWLTTQTKMNSWGSIAGNSKNYHPAAWIGGHLMESKPEHIWYWLREGRRKRPLSCTEIRLRFLVRGQKPKSGIYEIQSADGKVISTFCDMESFGGGWTLVLNRVSNAGWTKATTLSRDVDKASKSTDYSILQYSKGIANLKQKEESTFQYMIEADGDKMWGGVFEANIEDALTECNIHTRKPTILKKFNDWDESKCNLAKRVPYILDNPSSYFTTETKAANGEDGVLVSSSPSIYIKGSKEKPNFIRMWVRESASQKSCNQIKVKGQRNGIVYKSGFYTAKKSGPSIRTLYCDMKSDVGAWTLLVTSAHGKWTKDQVLSRNEDFPSISNDYSILGIADSIKEISNNATFKYKLDAHRFNHWGGIWEAPISYTFVFDSHKQEGVKLLKQFDKWSYNVWYKSVNNRMPWLGQRAGILTTSGTADKHWWGTIISDNLQYKPAPWISWQMKNPGVIWYWLNEDDCSPNRKPVHGGMTQWTEWSPCSLHCGTGSSTRERSCIKPKPRCGGAPCDPKLLTKESKVCSGKCDTSPIKSYNSQYCVLPLTGGCSPADETGLVWKKGIGNCDLPEAEFTYDTAAGGIVHKCSGKPVCPAGGSTRNGNKLVMSTKCPKMSLSGRFSRTIYGTLNFGPKCIHSNNGRLGENVNLVLWTGCSTTRHQTLFYKLGNGPVHVKMWTNVKAVTNAIKDFTNDVRFPRNPSSTGVLDNFDSPYGMGGNNYGLLLWSYFVPPETGWYTFYSACDDVCQVFLSTTDQASDKKKIIDQKGWSNQYQFDKRSDQKSNKIFLKQKSEYYMEALLFEVGGGDHLSVRADLPSGKILHPITGHYLRSRG